MKKGLLKPALCFMALLSFVACSSSDSDGGDFRLYVYDNYLEPFSYEGGSQIVHVDARLGNNATSWKVSNYDKFINVSPTTGNGYTDVIITVDKNNTDMDRWGNVRFETLAMDFKNGGDSYTLNISQEANPESNVSVGTNDPSEIYAEVATLSGSVSGAKGYVQGGFYYGTSLYALNNSSSTKNVGNGKFEVVVDGLIPGTIYYCQAFVKDGSKIVKSQDIKSFTTLDNYIYVWPETMNFSYEGGSEPGGVSSFEVVAFTNELAWSVSINTADFVNITPKSGTGYTGITVTASKNNTDKTRSGYIEFKAGNKTQIMSITQDAKSGETHLDLDRDDFGSDSKLDGNAPELSADKTSLSFYASPAGTQTVQIKANCAWTVDSKPSWCTVTPSSGSGNGQLSVLPQTNTTTSARTGTIVIKAKDNSAQISIKVSQEAGGSTNIGKDDFTNDKNLN